MIFIWSCWLPFESGTALSLNFKAVMAFCTANLSAASGSLTWTLLTCEYALLKKDGNFANVDM
jgi:ammonia channel protein AmtB